MFCDGGFKVLCLVFLQAGSSWRSSPFRVRTNYFWVGDISTFPYVFWRIDSILLTNFQTPPQSFSRVLKALEHIFGSHQHTETLLDREKSCGEAQIIFDISERAFVRKRAFPMYFGAFLDFENVLGT